MANENKKDFNLMLKNNKDMPKINIIEDKKTINIYGGDKMVIAPPIDYDLLIKQIPNGKLCTSSILRDFLKNKYNADFTDPLTSGIFINIVAWASYQRKEDITPFWRVIKTDGMLNLKYPEAITLQKKLLENEGYEIILKGKKNIKYYVKDYEKYLIDVNDFKNIN